VSATLSTTRQNVRYLLGDIRPSNYARSSQDLDRIILDKAVSLGSRVGLGLTWTASQVTLTAGSTADYTLSAATTQFDRIIAARINATGYTLRKVSFDHINSLREYLTSTTAGQGDPTAFALWEDATQVVNMRIDTVPSTARTIDFLRSTLPSQTVADSTTLPFSDLFLRTVEKAAALEAGLKTTQDERDRIKLNPEVFSKWQEDVERGLMDERARMAQIKAAPYGMGRILGR